MKQITALFALLFCASLAFGQTIEKSMSIVVYDIVPTVTPCTYCSEFAFVRANDTVYWWDGDSWEKWYDGNSYLTSLVQDSIIVTTRFGVEVDRDTVRLPVGDVAITSLPADSVTITDSGGYYTTDNVEDALQEGAVERLVLDGLIGNLVTLSGVPVTSTDLGTFAGVIIPDNQTNKEAFQALETNAQSLADSKLDSLTFSPNVDTTYTVVRQYAGGAVAQMDTIWFPAVSGGGGGSYTAGYGLDLAGSQFSVDTTEVATQNDINLLLGTSGYIPKYTTTGTVNSVMREGSGNIGINVSPASSRQLHIHNPDGAVTYAMLTNNSSGAGPNDGFQFVMVGANISLINREVGGMDFRVSDSNYFLRSTSTGDVSFTGGVAQYKVDIGTTGVLRLPNTTTGTRGVGRTGYTSWNTTTGALDGHNGTSFGRYYLSTDVTPTNGQIKIFDSSLGMDVYTTPTYGTMSSWTLAADTGTPATITDGTTATIAGSTEGIDVAISGSTATVSLDYSEVAVTTSLGGNEYFQIYDVADGNRQVHVDSLPSYLGGSMGIYSGSGTIPNNTTAQTAAGAGFIIDGEGYIQITGTEILANADIWATNAPSISFTARNGEGTEMMTLTDGVMSFSPDSRALISSQTSGRAVMFDGSNEVSEFPLESTGGLTRQTQATAFELARGTTGERPTASTAGRLRWNTTNSKPEISNGSSYDNLATEDYVDEAITETNFTQNSDLAIFPDKKIEHVTLESTSGAVSNTTLSLPTAGTAYEGYLVKVWSIDTSGSYDNEVTASTIQNGATTGATITLGNFQATEISCIRVGTSSYRWVVTNQY